MILRAEGITKHFGAVVALAGVDLQLDRGEVLGLVGDNGAGKSTLVKILCGFQRPDTGRIFVEGHEVTFHSGKGRPGPAGSRRCTRTSPSCPS